MRTGPLAWSQIIEITLILFMFALHLPGQAGAEMFEARSHKLGNIAKGFMHRVIFYKRNALTRAARMRIY